jgi:hypothetical protein
MVWPQQSTVSGLYGSVLSVSGATQQLPTWLLLSSQERAAAAMAALPSTAASQLRTQRHSLQESGAALHSPGADPLADADCLGCV